MYLREIAEIIFSFPEKDEVTKAEWICPAFLQEENVLTETKTEIGLKPSKSSEVRGGDIVIKRIQPQFVNYISKDANAHAGQNLVIVRSTGHVSPKYLAYLMERDIHKLYNDTTGTVLTSVNRKSFDNFDVGDLPPLNIQVAIGELWWLEKEKSKLCKELLIKEKQQLLNKLRKLMK